MEINIVSRIGKEDDRIELPPGFRFHPTDEELITHYLSPKVLDSSFSACAMGEVDLNKCEPWDLPWRAKMGEKEWYFFCVRDRKYPTGLRTNRATEAGYWKATGKDKEIYRAKTLIGMKKTLVFYKGRAPRGEKTNWIMHEYRLEWNIPEYNPIKTTKNEWVICRIFQKCSGGKKTIISGLVRLGSHGNQLRSCLLPPLTDSPPHESETKTTVGSHVTCFSDPLEDQKTKDDMVDSFDNNGYLASSSTSNGSFTFPRTTPTEPYPSTQVATSVGISELSDSFLLQDQSILRMLLNTKAELSWQGDLSSNDMSSTVANQEMVHKSFGDQLEYLPSTSAGPVDFGCLWNY